ncbi:stage II sporulation protein D [Natronincola peptidivorans]|uniref:Stage II sporulation protein D n=1 Tax=Natronincola peptidivorans TaxID=426128 RepID=A0A1H9YX87_9FIRM|nr:SpoIID/LytB domain-containing protein [Natronincola peptidivorans]SES73816.1 stage II sporulation protein D [Natronincola peptidivorans]
MKKTRLFLLLYIVITMTLVNLQTGLAFNKTQIPLHIEIGLFYEGTAKSTVHLKSINGFEIGKFSGDHFDTILNLYEPKEIILRKDSYYIGTGGSFLEYTGPISNGMTNINLQGPYHVQISNGFNNRQDAEHLIDSLSFMEDKAYLVYENGWKVFTGLYTDPEEAGIKAAEIQSISGETTKIITPSLTRVQVLDLFGKPIFMFDSNEDIYFRGFQDKANNTIVNIDGKNYRGAVTAKRMSNSDMSIVNKLLLEEYLYGVVPREMPASWSIEALKAQAVVARGYAVSNINRWRSVGFDLCNTTRSQVYGGYDDEHPNSNRAVSDTASRVLTHNGKLVNAFYHANSGGHTENSENVWSQPIPYILGVYDEFSLNAPNSTWTEVLTKNEVRDMLEKNNVFVGEVNNIKVTSVSENGRVLELTIYGTSGTEVLIKENSRRIFGLRSTWFTVDGAENPTNDLHDIMVKNTTNNVNKIELHNKSIISANGVTKISNPSNIKIYNGKNYRSTETISSKPADTFVFRGKGFGHGLGMSQHGARKMAEEGYNYIEILSHYYTGVKVE